MNILYNITSLSRKSGGVYQYSVALLKIMAKSSFDGNFFVFCKNPGDDIKDIIADNSNFHFTRINPTFIDKLYLTLYNKFNRVIKSSKRKVKLDLLDLILKEHEIDIIHTPTQNIILKPGFKTITTLHDVQELHFPEFFTSAERSFRAVHYKKCIDNADAVIVSYNHVKKDILRYFAKPAEQVHEVLLDMQDLWFENFKDEDNMALNKFDLPESFLLYPASTWMHKNHLNLLQAIKSLNNEIKLVLTGNPTKYYDDVLLPYIKENKLEERVFHLGVVSDKELFALYHSCKAVVVPTLYEAGSFPLMESILMNIPVVCSNVTSLPETIGNIKFVFDPMNISDMKNKIKLIWSNEEYRKANITLLKVQAKKLMYNHASEKIQNIYHSIAQASSDTTSNL